ncbi:MAG: hypothetical protein SPF77_06705 [Gemmiger sp.]|uniref:hypothetical protein n=1 Tax=Gemmiger sp. TaxID=2049027 RepID=UPI002A919726|nr:hypothetical protein [Gemmiger sp.]MDY5502249.1 hypothetical protein [Gemmiger sp.]
MEKEQNHNGTALEKADNREYVYVRYECNDDDEMDIYDIIDLCKKGVLILKRYIVLLLIFVLAGSVLGCLKAKHDASEAYTSSALLFVDLNREQYETSTLSMLAKSFSQIVNSDSIMTPVSNKFSVSNVDVTVPDGTQTIQVTVTADNASDAKEGCASLVNAGIDAVTSATNYATITVVSPASEAAQSSMEDTAKDTAITAVIFLLVALAIVTVRELAFAYRAHETAKANM